MCRGTRRLKLKILMNETSNIGDSVGRRLIAIGFVNMAIFMLALVTSKLVIQNSAVKNLWADHGSGSAHDVTVWSTAPPADFLALGDYAQVGYGDAGTFSNWEVPYGPPLAVRELNASEGLLAAPIGWTKLYTASASSPFTLWRPAARAGYVSLGDVGTVDGKEPPAGKYTTVHESCVVSCPADVMLWGDKDGRVALYGARGDEGARAVSTGSLLADVVSYPTGALVAQQMALCLKPSCLSDSDDVPEQLHIALGYTPDTMAVQWAAAVGGGASTLCSRGKAVAVHYGFKGGALSRSAVADCTPFNLGSGQLSQENWNASTTRPLIATLIHSTEQRSSICTDCNVHPHALIATLIHIHTRHAHAPAPALIATLIPLIATLIHMHTRQLPHVRTRRAALYPGI